MTISRKGSFIKEDLVKVGRGALVAGAGAGLFYILEALPSVDFGETWSPIVVALLAVLSNAIRKLWNKNVYK